MSFEFGRQRIVDLCYSFDFKWKHILPLLLVIVSIYLAKFEISNNSVTHFNKTVITVC